LCILSSRQLYFSSGLAGEQEAPENSFAFAVDAPQRSPKGEKEEEYLLQVAEKMSSKQNHERDLVYTLTANMIQSFPF
jgi:hypothetical protein